MTSSYSRLRWSIRERVVKLTEESDALRRELIARDTRIQELESELHRDAQMVFERNAFWKGAEGPFCPKCWGDERKEMRMIKQRPDAKMSICPKCKTLSRIDESPDQPTGREGPTSAWPPRPWRDRY